MERLVADRLTPFFSSKRINADGGIVRYELNLIFKTDAELDEAIKQLGLTPYIK